MDEWASAAAEASVCLDRRQLFAFSFQLFAGALT